MPGKMVKKQTNTCCCIEGIFNLKKILFLMVLSNKLNSEFLKLPYRNLSMIIRQGLPLGGNFLFWEYTFTLLYTIDMWSHGYCRKYFLKEKVKFPFLVPTVVSLSWPRLLLLKAVKTYFLSQLLVISSKVLYGCTMSWQVKIKRNPCNGKHVENANSQHSCQLSPQLLRWKKNKNMRNLESNKITSDLDQGCPKLAHHRAQFCPLDD